jgi:glycosyltransferase involved in cell wall biosynthesis
MITVLMPAYNATAYIREAIESVLVQSYADFEFLIINDGSTDDTEAIIRSYSDERIRVYTQENKGVIGALNQGLQLAKGKYIARFDADDICYPNRLLEQHNYMTAHPDCVLLGGASDYIDKDGNFLFEWQPLVYDTGSIREKILTECPLDHPTVMFEKEVAIKSGGYPEGALHFEDHLFWTQFFKYGNVANLKMPLIKHRFNPDSVTIDEKWRGKIFNEIKYRSIRNGFITPADKEHLKNIVKHQDVKKYKDAAYYSMIAKKYLWNQHDSIKARAHLSKAISIIPYKMEPYLLYLLSFLPENIIKLLYKKAKNNK